MTKAVIIAIFALALVLIGASVVSAQENPPGQALGNSAALCPLANGTGTGTGSGPGSMMQNIDPEQMQQLHDSMMQNVDPQKLEEMHNTCHGQAAGDGDGTTSDAGGAAQTPPASAQTARTGTRSRMM